jgi:hypothetical protein
MKATALVFGMIEWVLTLGVSLVLLLFGADRISQWLASAYAYGAAANADVGLTAAGFGAMIAIFLLIHPETRWYTAAALTAFLVVSSLSSLSFGEPQPTLVPLLGLACAVIVQLSHRVSSARRSGDAAHYIPAAAADSDGDHFSALKKAQMPAPAKFGQL